MQSDILDAVDVQEVEGKTKIVAFSAMGTDISVTGYNCYSFEVRGRGPKVTRSRSHPKVTSDQAKSKTVPRPN